MLDFLEHLFFDPGPVRALQRFIGTDHVAAFEILSLLGDTWGLMFVTGLTLWLWGRRPAYAVLAISALGAVLRLGLSKIFQMPRPPASEVLIAQETHGHGFPSGHVYETVLPWGLLYVYRLVPWAVPLVLFVLSSLGRLYLGLHDLGDVVFGGIFAVPTIWAFHALWRRAGPWLAEQPLWAYAAAGAVAVAVVGVNLALGAADNPRRWEILGFAAGTAAGLLVEYRYVRFRPAAGWDRLWIALTGTAGLAALILLDRLVLPEAPVYGAVSAAAGVLWCFLLVPLLFRARTERTPASR